MGASRGTPWGGAVVCDGSLTGTSGGQMLSVAFTSSDAAFARSKTVV